MMKKFIIVSTLTIIFIVGFGLGLGFYLGRKDSKYDYKFPPLHITEDRPVYPSGDTYKPHYVSSPRTIAEKLYQDKIDSGEDDGDKADLPFMED